MIDNLKELYESRDLLFNLVKRELKVKYKKSALGFFWSLFNPLLTMLVFTFVFAFILKIVPPPNTVGKTNFPIFLLAALLPWNFFSTSIGSAVGSIVFNSNLIRKVYFPREILPLSIVLANLVNFCLELVVLFSFLIFFGYPFFVYLPFLIIIIFVQLVFTAGVSLIFAFLNVYFRDVQHFVGIILMIWFYANPIIYDFNQHVGAQAVKYPLLAFVYKLNPQADLILSFRDVLYFCKIPDFKVLGYATVASFATLFVAYYLFKRYDPSFAEEV